MSSGYTGCTTSFLPSHFEQLRHEKSKFAVPFCKYCSDKQIHRYCVIATLSESICIEHIVNTLLCARAVLIQQSCADKDKVFISVLRDTVLTDVAIVAGEKLASVAYTLVAQYTRIGMTGIKRGIAGEVALVVHNVSVRWQDIPVAIFQLFTCYALSSLPKHRLDQSEFKLTKCHRYSRVTDILCPVRTQMPSVVALQCTVKANAQAVGHIRASDGI